MSVDLAAFMDSNVLVYAVSADEPEKQSKAREILEAARQAGCTKVLSEDLGDGQVHGGITVENPFSTPGL